MKLDFLTPSLGPDFDPSTVGLGDTLCHWRIDRSTRPLSLARKSLLEKADTPWVLFVDDDVEFNTAQVKQLTDRIRTDVGALESNTRVPGIDRIARNKTGWITRAWTGFTLVRRSATLGWNPPPIRRYEDEHLRRYVLARGYSWSRVVSCVVVHHVEDRGLPGPLELHYEDGRGAWYALPGEAKAWMVLKTLIFARHGPRRFRAHLYFLSGMFSSALRGDRWPSQEGYPSEHIPKEDHGLMP